MKMIRSKRTLLILVSVICIALFGALSANATEDNDTLGEFVRIQCEAGEIDENLGDNTVLSEVYDGIESRILSGESTAEAERNAKNDLLLREATYCYAINQGFALSPDELENKFDIFISDMKSAEEYDEIEKYYAANHQTLEDNIYANYHFYETKFVISELYSFYQKKYGDGDSFFYGKSYETWDEYWAEVQNVALHDFKQTNDYAVLKEATNDAISTIEDGGVEEIISDDLSAAEKKDVVVETAVYDNLSYEHTEER